MAFKRNMMAVTLLGALLLSFSPSPLVEGAKFVVEKSTLRVKAPDFAASFPSAIGDFGVPNYGAILVGQVGYVEDNGQGCSDIVRSLPSGANILLVDRGSCYFVEKAWHAQQSGALAVIVADNIQEEILTMAIPEDLPQLAQLVDKITIPTVLVTKSAGDQIKDALRRAQPGQVTVELDWSDSIAHPDNRVEWEVWFTTNDACGVTCTAQRDFFKNFRTLGGSLEQQGYAQFTPHVMLRQCPWGSPDCDRDCTHNRRYCAVEPVPASYAGQYSGADVVEMNTRHLCAFRTANSSNEPWRWWDFAGYFAGNCTMEARRFDSACAKEQMAAAGIDAGAVEGCVGMRTSDSTHDVLEAELQAQNDVDNTGRGKVIMLPTVVINADQFRGRLAAAAVLRALCSGFSEGTEPALCLAGGLEVDECAAGNHGCWTQEDLTACVDTFRGFVCRCPKGWEGDGHTCTDVDECALGVSGCDQICVNEPGSYHCECEIGYDLHGGRGAPGMCVPNTLGKIASQTHVPAWLMALLFALGAAAVATAGFVAYRWRLRQEMRVEIREIMREYMPLDGGDASELGSGLLGRVGGGGRKSSGYGMGFAKAPQGAGGSGGGYEAPYTTGSGGDDTENGVGMSTLGGSGGSRHGGPL